MGLIESNEYLRRSHEQELSFESIEVKPMDVKKYSNYDEIEAIFGEAPTLEFSITL